MDGRLTDTKKNKNKLPDELWQYIMSFFAWQHRLIPVKLVSKKWKRLAENANIPYAELNYDQLINSHKTENYIRHREIHRCDCFLILSRSTFLTGYNNDLYLYDLNNTYESAFGDNYNFKVMQGHTDYIRSICLINKNTQAITGSDDKTLRIWDLQKYECIKSLEGHTGAVNKIIALNDSTILSSSVDCIRKWNLDQYTSEIIFTTNEPVVDMIKLTDNLFICATLRSLGIYDIEKKIWIKKIDEYTPNMEINSICLTSDNQLFVSIGIMKYYPARFIFPPLAKASKHIVLQYHIDKVNFEITIINTTMALTSTKCKND